MKMKQKHNGNGTEKECERKTEIFHLQIINNLLTMILIHLTINLDHNPLVSSIWCQVHPGQGGHHAGAAQQHQEQY